MYYEQIKFVSSTKSAICVKQLNDLTNMFVFYISHDDENIITTVFPMEQSLIKQAIIFLSTDSSDYLPGEPKTFFQCLHILQHVQANPDTDSYLDTL